MLNKIRPLLSTQHFLFSIQHSAFRIQRSAFPPMSLGILEIASWSAAMAATDAAAKAAPVRVIQAELNDMLGGVVKLEGDTAAVEAALAAGRAMAEMMHARCSA